MPKPRNSSDSWPYIRYLAQIPAFLVNFFIPFFISVIFFIKAGELSDSDNFLKNIQRERERERERERAAGIRIPSHINFSVSGYKNSNNVHPLSVQ